MLNDMKGRTTRRRAEPQPRDLTFLLGLFECRVMTLAHATLMYFGGRYDACKKRVQALKAAGLVRERPRQPYQPSVLFLTRRGFAVITAAGLTAPYPKLSDAAFERRVQVSDRTLRHELDVMDVKAAFVSAVAAAPNLSVSEFSTWPALYEFRCSPAYGDPYGQHDVCVKPDGFIRLREQAADGVYEHALYLEVDRSTESLEVLTRRANAYRDYYRGGGFAARYGGPREEFQSYPFRVIYLFLSEVRRNNFAERLLAIRPPVLSQAWLATQHEALRNPLGPIWITASDYRNVLQGSGYDAIKTLGRHTPHPQHRREVGREELVEGRIAKHNLTNYTLV